MKGSHRTTRPVGASGSWQNSRGLAVLEEPVYSLMNSQAKHTIQIPFTDLSCQWLIAFARRVRDNRGKEASGASSREARSRRAFLGRAACSEPHIDNNQRALRPLNIRSTPGRHGGHNDAGRIERSLCRLELHDHTQWLVRRSYQPSQCTACLHETVY